MRECGTFSKFREEMGRTPLGMAGLHGNKEIVPLLLAAGAPVGSVDAALLDDPPMLLDLLEAGTNVDAPNIGGMTPLMAASARGNNEMVSVLLARNAEIDATDKEGRTPLICAILHRHLATVRLLIEQGADVNRTGVHEAIIASIQSMLALKEQNPNKTREETLAAIEAEGQTTSLPPLTHAARLNDVECARLLLEHGADVDAMDCIYSGTALGPAIEGGYVDMVRLLLAHGADPRRDQGGSSPLSLAQSRMFAQNPEMIALLKTALTLQAH